MLDQRSINAGVGVFDQLSIGVCLIDSENRIRVWSNRLQELGLPFGDVAGMPLAELLPAVLPVEEQREKALAAIQSVRSRCEENIRLTGLEFHFPSPVSADFDLVISGQQGESGSLLLLFKEVSEAPALREQFERLLDSTPDGIFVIDAERRIKIYNQACGRICGTNPAEILHKGAECKDVTHCHTEDGRSYASQLCPARALFNGEADHLCEEMLLTNSEGEERWVETHYSAIKNDTGRVDYVIGVLRDVHERKELEERLHQSEKLASLGQLIAGVAHEIKNPLAIILTSLDIIENPERSGEQRKEACQYVREEVQRLDSRLRTFLHFARPRPLNPTMTLLPGILRRTVQNLEPAFPDIEFDVHSSSPEPLVYADPDQINQVLTNLILNACEALEGEGAIHLRSYQEGDQAVLEVEDNGPGIPRDQATRIFDPFYTTKSDGAGLGLSICYQIILAHKGTISLDPGMRNGQGTKFTVRLPMANRAG